tara:strand:+ start:297 stop:482 length:186 start_codon:yes stop_codon:yes gene_type:complete
MYVVVKNNSNIKHNNSVSNKTQKTSLLTLISKEEKINKKITNLKKIRDINGMEISFNVFLK